MLKRKVALVAAIITIAGIAASSAVAADPSDIVRAGWGNGAIHAAQVGPPGSSVNPGPIGEQVLAVIWNFLQNLFKLIFPWW